MRNFPNFMSIFNPGHIYDQIDTAENHYSPYSRIIVQFETIAEFGKYEGIYRTDPAKIRQNSMNEKALINNLQIEFLTKDSANFSFICDLCKDLDCYIYEFIIEDVDCKKVVKKELNELAEKYFDDGYLYDEDVDFNYIAFLDAFNYIIDNQINIDEYKTLKSR